MRGEFTHFLGQAVGNQVATVFDTYVNIEEGVFKGGVGLVQTVDQLDPTRFLYDPKGAASTWAGLGETVVKANPLYALVDPGGALKNDLGLVKGLVHAEDWRSDRPGLGFGENIFDVATLFVPGAGEAGAGAEGAAAGTRAAARPRTLSVGGARRAGGRRGGRSRGRRRCAGRYRQGGRRPDEGLRKPWGRAAQVRSSDQWRSGGLVGPEAVRRAGRANSPDGFRDVGQGADRSAGRRARCPAGGKGPFDPPTAPPGWEPPEPPGTPVGPHDPVPGPGGGPVSTPAAGPHDPASGPLSGRPSALPTPHGGGTHGLGHGAPAGSPLPGRPPHDVGNGNSPGSRPPGEQPSRDNTPHGSHDGGGDHDGAANAGDHPTVVPPFSWDDRLALADYTELDMRT